MGIRKLIGIVFLVVSVITFIIFITQTEFSIQLQAWVSFKFYIQFAPYFISVMLFYSGLYLLRKDPKANFAMAIFGYTILELVILDWFGISSNALGIPATIMFGCCAIAALWIAHANSFRLKKLSLVEILISVIIGAIESLLLYYLQHS